MARSLTTTSYDAISHSYPQQQRQQPQQEYRANGRSWYRGGFSTSICNGLFAEHTHSDCCALTCCGVLLYDRNNYLLTNQRPSWNYRCCNAILLLAVFILWIVSLAVSTTSEEEEDKDKNVDNDRVQGTSTRAPVKEPEFQSQFNPGNDVAHYHLSAVLFGVLVAMSFYFLFQAANQRFKLRRILMVQMYEEQVQSTDKGGETSVEIRGIDANTYSNTDVSTPLMATARADVETFLKLQEPYVRSPHRICSCLPKDDIIVSDPHNHTSQSEDNNSRPDLCQCLWRIFSALCCGAFCGCWLQLCGMCAIGQEDRELQLLLPAGKFQMDFVTFQPFQDYRSKLENLRQNDVKSMWTHMKTLSQLSKGLVQILVGILVALTLIAFSGLDPFFRPVHLAVVVLVLLQSFIILYFVHWFWNRFDLSFDAVVKYFASGFILGTTNAFVFEILVSTGLQIGAIIIKIVVFFIMMKTGKIGNLENEGLVDDVHNNTDDVSNASQEGPALQMVPIWLLVIVAFLDAFAVAALVEETTKYFGFWMVEHPDLIGNYPYSNNGNESVPSNIVAGQETNTLCRPQMRSLTSVGAGITIAMVTTAMGFACCENFMYVFFYARPASPSTEIATLLARSIFPVHPLAAAIQSIGVCRRDLENDKSVGFGWIIFPAVLVHGSFDFALMLLDLLYNRSAEANQATNNDDDNDERSLPQRESSADDVSLQEQLPALASSIGIVLVGFIYYLCKARAQRKRLQELDKQRSGTSEYEQLS